MKLTLTRSIVSLAALVLWGSAAADAASVNFVDAVTGAPCGGTTACSTTADGVGVGVRASATDSTLTWSEGDGVGVASGSENPEWMSVTFNQAVRLSAIHLADFAGVQTPLFAFRAMSSRCATFSINEGPAREYCGGTTGPTALRAANNGMTLWLDEETPVTSVKFAGYGRAGSDFLLKGLDFNRSIPEPGVLALVGLGLVGMTARLRRRRQ